METKTDRIFTIPNLLSFLRLAMIPLIMWLYLGKQAYVAAGILLAVSGLTDLVDGYLARRFHWISDLGKVLDPVADKLTQGAMLLCLTLRYPLMLLPVCIMAAKELFMMISGPVVIRKTGQVISAQWHGKIATAMLYAMMILHVFWAMIPAVVSNVCIVLTACAIALSFVLYAASNIRALFGK